MEPGRLKKSRPEWAVDELVLAKVKGFPKWPARVGNAEDLNHKLLKNKVFVIFFGPGKTVRQCAPAELSPFSATVRDELLSGLSKRKAKPGFREAVEEICEEFDWRQQNPGKVRSRPINGDTDTPGGVTSAATVDAWESDSTEKEVEQVGADGSMPGGGGGQLQLEMEDDEQPLEEVRPRLSKPAGTAVSFKTGTDQELASMVAHQQIGKVAVASSELATVPPGHGAALPFLPLEIGKRGRHETERPESDDAGMVSPKRRKENFVSGDKNVLKTAGNTGLEEAVIGRRDREGDLLHMETETHVTDGHELKEEHERSMARSMAIKLSAEKAEAGTGALSYGRRETEQRVQSSKEVQGHRKTALVTEEAQPTLSRLRSPQVEHAAGPIVSERGLLQENTASTTGERAMTGVDQEQAFPDGRPQEGHAQLGEGECEKRKRGRPRKNSVEMGKPLAKSAKPLKFPSKRGRGRPRKEAPPARLLSDSAPAGGTDQQVPMLESASLELAARPSLEVNGLLRQTSMGIQGGGHGSGQMLSVHIQSTELPETTLEGAQGTRKKFSKGKGKLASESGKQSKAGANRSLGRPSKRFAPEVDGDPQGENPSTSTPPPADSLGDGQKLPFGQGKIKSPSSTGGKEGHPQGSAHPQQSVVAEEVVGKDLPARASDGANILSTDGDAEEHGAALVGLEPSLEVHKQVEARIDIPVGDVGPFLEPVSEDIPMLPSKDAGTEIVGVNAVAVADTRPDAPTMLKENGSRMPAIGQGKGKSLGMKTQMRKGLKQATPASEVAFERRLTRASSQRAANAGGPPDSGSGAGQQYPAGTSGSGEPAGTPTGDLTAAATSANMVRVQKSEETRPKLELAGEEELGPGAVNRNVPGKAADKPGLVGAEGPAEARVSPLQSPSQKAVLTPQAQKVVETPRSRGRQGGFKRERPKDVGSGKDDGIVQVPGGSQCAVKEEKDDYAMDVLEEERKAAFSAKRQKLDSQNKELYEARIALSGKVNEGQEERPKLHQTAGKTPTAAAQPPTERKQGNRDRELSREKHTSTGPSERGGESQPGAPKVKVSPAGKAVGGAERQERGHVIRDRQKEAEHRGSHEPDVGKKGKAGRVNLQEAGEKFRQGYRKDKDQKQGVKVLEPESSMRSLLEAARARQEQRTLERANSTPPPSFHNRGEGDPSAIPSPPSLLPRWEKGGGTYSPQRLRFGGLASGDAFQPVGGGAGQASPSGQSPLAAPGSEHPSRTSPSPDALARLASGTVEPGDPSPPADPLLTSAGVGNGTSVPPPGGVVPVATKISSALEAEVAKETMANMLENLSRTKESIGKVTRFAMESLQNGMHGQLIELIVSRMEADDRLHKRGDLFLLLDSISQSSARAFKGGSRVSYLTDVEANLRRALAAAAPAGREALANRQICRKCLDLWMQREVLAGEVLKPIIQELEERMKGDEACKEIPFAGGSRRPLRSERALDDPLREMGDMVVDEYGSNAGYSVPGSQIPRVDEAADEGAHSLPPPDLNAAFERVRQEAMSNDAYGPVGMADASAQHQCNGEVQAEAAPMAEDGPGLVEAWQPPEADAGGQGEVEGIETEVPAYAPPLPPLPPPPSSPPPSPPPLPASPPPSPPPLPPPSPQKPGPVAPPATQSAHPSAGLYSTSPPLPPVPPPPGLVHGGTGSWQGRDQAALSVSTGPQHGIFMVPLPPGPPPSSYLHPQGQQGTKASSSAVPPLPPGKPSSVVGSSHGGAPGTALLQAPPPPPPSHPYSVSTDKSGVKLGQSSQSLPPPPPPPTAPPPHPPQPQPAAQYRLQPPPLPPSSLPSHATMQQGQRLSRPIPPLPPQQAYPYCQPSQSGGGSGVPPSSEVMLSGGRTIVPPWLQQQQQPPLPSQPLPEQQQQQQQQQQQGSLSSLTGPQHPDAQRGYYQGSSSAGRQNHVTGSGRPAEALPRSSTAPLPPGSRPSSQGPPSTVPGSSGSSTVQPSSAGGQGSQPRTGFSSSTHQVPGVPAYSSGISQHSGTAAERTPLAPQPLPPPGPSPSSRPGMQAAASLASHYMRPTMPPAPGSGASVAGYQGGALHRMASAGQMLSPPGMAPVSSMAAMAGGQGLQAVHMQQQQQHTTIHARHMQQQQQQMQQLQMQQQPGLGRPGGPSAVQPQWRISPP